ncbi:MAG: hypothetical protein M1816_006582 [Peltula sp. TS41687]|nr:MAG: hypothetical protein M1816_006582 [Peltula sp. TS41687]
MTTGEYVSMPSPCGSNCSYTVQFEGPYLECNISSSTSIHNLDPYPTDQTQNLEIHHKESPVIYDRTSWQVNGLWTLEGLEITAYEEEGLAVDRDVNMTFYNMSCIPSRAQYTLNNSYKNNNQRVTYSARPLGKLINVANGTKNQTNVDCSASGKGSIIINTKLNRAFNEYQLFQRLNGPPPTPKIDITQKLLNELLANITISIMSVSDIWNTTTNTTQSTSVNIFTFSRPLNLILPCSLLLFFALPFLLLGSLALYQNGVSATDGGFTQILTTTTGIGVVQKVAAGGCLGGEENIPKELRELKIQFGELIERENGEGGSKEGERMIRRAGFGVEGEVMPLTKRELYGS